VVTEPMSASQILVGIVLTLGLAVACQIIAAKIRSPAIVLLLPVGFVAGALTTVINPDKIFGAAFPPLVSLAVAVVLFDGGLDLVTKELQGESRRVVHRLRDLGIPMTWAGAGFFGWLLLGLSWKTAVMLGAILIVSGPTVVTPIMRAARPGKKLSSILEFEGTTVDPIGAIIAVVVFNGLKASHAHTVPAAAGGFAGRIGIGVAGGAIGIAVLWLLLTKMKLSGILAVEAIFGTVIVMAGLCDAIQDDTGLVAAITMGVVIANWPGIDLPRERPMLKSLVQLIVGVLFISISATVTPASLRGVIWPTLGLVACLVLLVRPAVAVVATARTSLTRHERIFIGSMDPRGIVAASTAASFSAPLVALHIGGANKLLAATFLVIVGTVTIYGLAAVPLARKLSLREPEPEPEKSPAEQPP
jgi:NhaP-type Na+/H+ or K+/H+ antiporter